MVKEYIEREDAVEATWRILNGIGYSEKHNDRLVEEVDAVLNEYPAADVRPVVRGEWHEYDDDYGKICCSVCEEDAPCDYPWNYCPNCGADMREES